MHTHIYTHRRIYAIPTPCLSPLWRLEKLNSSFPAFLADSYGRMSRFWSMKYKGKPIGGLLKTFFLH